VSHERRPHDHDRPAATRRRLRQRLHPGRPRRSPRRHHPPAHQRRQVLEPAPLTVDIQLGDRDTRAVDTLADLYGIAADPGDPLLYSRKGHTVMAGDTVAVRVYCTRPLQVVPR
jgi:hypothetical protein